MTAERVIELSPYLEKGFALLLLAGAGGLVARRLAGRSPEWTDGASEGIRGERALLLLVLLGALVTRTLWYADLGLPRWYYAETTVLLADRALEARHLGRQWLDLLGTTHLDWLHQSAVMMPVTVAFQALLGPSFQLPTLVGSFWGVLAVLLAWALGRAIRSPLFGLVFAGFVAASPLQITWARLGGLQIGATTHVLLVLWLSYLAGSRRSILLTVAAGLATWATFYHYYAARVAFPLAALALFAGLRASRPGALRWALVFGVFGLSLAGLHLATHREDAWQALWPSYPGYVGNQGEQSLVGIAEGALSYVGHEVSPAARAYFWRDRASPRWHRDGNVWRLPPDGGALTAGMEFGGLCLAPVALLGLLGFLSAVRHWKRDFPWLALALLGFLLPCLSTTTARRFLIFDLSVCAFAAEGLLVLLGSRWFLGGSPRQIVTAALAVVLGLAAYALVTVVALGWSLPPNQWAAIPFGESGFGDGRTCLGCLDAGRNWQKQIAQGAFVVLFDTDLERESPTIPGGLSLYGKLAALAARRSDAFVDYYDLASNFARHPLTQAGPIYDASRTDVVRVLADRIEQTRPARILWHFPQPTQWEEWLMERLVASGGVRTPLPHGPLTPIGQPPPEALPGAVIRTPGVRISDALRVLRELVRDSPPPGPCLRLEERRAEDLPRKPLFLAVAPGYHAMSPPEWTVGSWHQTLRQGLEVESADAIALAIEAPQDGNERLRFLTRDGRDVVHEFATGTRAEATLHVPTPIGHQCAAWLGEGWWVVDPVSGRLSTSARAESALPEGRWVGIASLGSDLLLLASADQSLHVVRPLDGRELLSFPALVPPSRRLHFGECTPVLSGDGWLATFDSLRSILSVYDERGAPLGSIRLDRLLGLGGHYIHAIGAAGHYLGVGYGDRVATLEVSVAPGCAGAGPPG